MSHSRPLSPGIRTVRLDRLQQYPDFDFAAVCRALGLGSITLESLRSVTAYGPRDGHDKRLNHAGRVKFFVDNLHQADAIIISNGAEEGLSSDEPFLYDGRHRFLAAVLRGDTTIKASFGFGELPARFLLPKRVREYLTGQTNIKP
jgi:hypothetical protein